MELPYATYTATIILIFPPLVVGMPGAKILMNENRLFLLARRAVVGFQNDNCTHMAAAISYYAVLSILPLALAAIAIFGFVVTSGDLEARLVDFITSQAPVSAEFLQSTIRGLVDARGPVGFVAALMLLWSGLGVFAAIRHSVNTAWGIAEDRSFLRGKLIDFAMLLAIGFLFVLSLILTFAIRVVQEFSELIPFVGSLGISMVWTWVAMLVPVALNLFIFIIIYKLAPRQRPPWGDLWLGALVAALGFELAKAGFAWYATEFANYSQVYGPVGTTIALMVWAYISAAVLLLGAEIAAEYARVMRPSSGHNAEL